MPAELDFPPDPPRRPSAVRLRVRALLDRVADAINDAACGPRTPWSRPW